MSKAEERALEAYPVFMTTLIPADNEHPLIEQDCNTFTREAYIKGYHQAEKDSELTWEDIDTIYKLLGEEFNHQLQHKIKTQKETCQEVLKRFNERKHVE